MSSAAARSGRVLETMGAPALSAPRVCLWCGGALVQRRAGARFCGASCRREHNRGSCAVSPTEGTRTSPPTTAGVGTVHNEPRNP